MSNNPFLNRDECSQLRAVAILGIVLHNYCHWIPGMSLENEFSFNQFYPIDFLIRITHPDVHLPMHIFSFLGHYGVALFVFLSGYGLVKKYERADAERVSLWQFTRYNYLKLFRLLIVGFIFFAAMTALAGSPKVYHIATLLGTLSMAWNLLGYLTYPGPFWYFGMTLQLYLLYRLVFYRWRHWSVVAGVIALSIVLQVALPHKAYYLHLNFPAHLATFGAGILAARHLATVSLSKAIWGTLLVVGLAALVAMSLNFYTWLVAPLVVIVAGIALIKVLPHSLAGVTTWLGSISSAIFIAHPIARFIIIKLYSHSRLTSGLLIYLMVSIAVAWLLHLLLQRIVKPTERFELPPAQAA